MAEEVTIYHNPRCSKSRKTLELIRARGVEPTVVEYLKAPLDAQAVMKLIELLGGDPNALVRTKEDAYRDAGLGPDSSAEQVARAIERAPTLLERPIVVRAGRAVMGRPPENVAGLLNDSPSPAPLLPGSPEYSRLQTPVSALSSRTSVAASLVRPNVCPIRRRRRCPMARSKGTRSLATARFSIAAGASMLRMAPASWWVVGHSM